jgi:hypothetical protein
MTMQEDARDKRISNWTQATGIPPGKREVYARAALDALRRPGQEATS